MKGKFLFKREKIIMDKRADRKSHRINGTKKNRLGTRLGIHDKNGKELCVGDTVMLGDKCIILWNNETKSYYAFICSSKWYGEDKYDGNSYGKGYGLRMDDGARMKIEKI